MPVNIYGGSNTDRRRIAERWAQLEQRAPWYVTAARISGLTISSDPQTRMQIAQYRHGMRDILVAPGVGEVLLRALAHELAHGWDDAGEENPHRFSTTPAWDWAWRTCGSFELPKYAQDKREHFADMAAKGLLIGTSRLGFSHPAEAAYIGGVVFPQLQAEYAATIRG